MTPGMRICALSVLLLSFVGCVLPTSSSSTTTTLGECSLDATLSLAEAHVGDQVAIGGGPFTGPDDTIVRVGGVQATLVDVDRSGCELCDACVTGDATCRCGTCAACDAACADCSEAVSFYVPEVPAGANSVVLINRYGATTALSIDVLPTVADTDVPADTDSP